MLATLQCSLTWFQENPFPTACTCVCTFTAAAISPTLRGLQQQAQSQPAVIDPIRKGAALNPACIFTAAALSPTLPRYGAGISSQSDVHCRLCRMCMQPHS